MNDELFSHIFTRYQHNIQSDLPSTLPLELPDDNSSICEIFEVIKPKIVTAVSQGQQDTAQELVDFAKAIAQQTNAPEHHALVAWCMAIFHHNRNIAQSVKYLDKARQFYADTKQEELEGRILIGYAGQLTQLGYMDQAEEAILRARTCLWSYPEYQDWPILYLNLALIQFYQGYYERMLASSQQSAALALKFYQNTSSERRAYYKSLQTQAIINQGLAATFLGQLEIAQILFNEALSTAKFYKWSEIIGRVNLNLARIHTSQGNLFAALSLLEEADKAFESVHIDIDRAIVLLCQSDIYKQLNTPVLARKSAVQAAELFIIAQVLPESVEAYLSAIQISLDLHEPKRARKYLKQSETLLSNVSPILQMLWHLYEFHITILQENSQEQRDTLDLVDNICAKLKNIASPTQYLNAALIAANLAAYLQCEDRIQRYQDIIQQAKAYRLLDIEQSACIQLANHQLLLKAIETLRQAADIVVYKRKMMPIEELKANLIAGHSSLYVNLIEAILQTKQPESALTTLIEAKAGLWFDLLTPSDPAVISPDWLQARSELSYWQQEIRTAQERYYIALCETRLKQAKKRIAKLAHTQHRRRATESLPSFSQIQSELNEQQVILDYLVGDQNLWICVISKTALDWVNLGPRTSIETLISRLNMLLQSLLYISPASNRIEDISAERKNVAQHQQTTIEKLFQDLFDLLIKPIKSLLPTDASNLIIVPDNYLFEIPWTALFDGKCFLGQLYHIVLLPSAALLNLPKSEKTSNLRDELLLLGCKGNPPLYSLAESLNTIEQIWPNFTTIYPAHTHHLLELDYTPKWLHIAAHGHVNRHTPILSQLELANGPLLLGDIFNLQLHGCELVTLNACETGTTPEQGGILLALAGSFLCAGAKNVIASLWSVDDQATTLLMQAFYTAYRSSLNATWALQQAQAELRTKGYHHPFYWAAFQIFARKL